MTIPINPVTIRPDFVERQQVSPELKLLIQALQHRQEIDIQRQQLKKEFEQLDLNKKLAGPQAEAVMLENEKRKRDLREHEEDLVASDQALQLYTGNLPRLGDAQGIGEVIAGIKDPKVAAHFYTLVTQGIKTYNDVTPNFQFRDVPGQTPTGQEVVGFNPQDPTKPVRTGVAAQKPTEAIGRIPVVTEREKASSAVGAIQANTIVNRVEALAPDIAARVARKVALRKGIFTGIIHRLSGTSREDADLLTEQAIEQSMDPQELEFYQAAKQWLANVIPGIAGKQMTAREYAIQAPAYFSMGGGTPTVTANRRKARITRTRGLIAEAGEAFTERIPEVQDLLGDYGIGPRSPNKRGAHDNFLGKPGHP